MDFTWVEAAAPDDEEEKEDFCTDCCWKLEPKMIQKLDLELLAKLPCLEPAVH
jgi:hypothetical protein